MITFTFKKPFKTVLSVVMLVIMYGAGFLEKTTIGMGWFIAGFIFIPTATMWIVLVNVTMGGDWGALQVMGVIISVCYDLEFTAKTRKPDVFQQLVDEVIERTKKELPNEKL